MINLDDALQTAITAARAAGEILQKRFRTDLQINTKENARDLVTEVDGQCQRVIIDVIQQSYPDHRFIGEEDGDEGLGDPDSPYDWIIDPLDGTTNFVHGRENFGTLIALQHEGVLQVGVMLNPMTDTLYTAVKGGGAFCNGKPAVLRETKGIMDAIITTNIIQRLQKDPEASISSLMPVCGAIHNYGDALGEMGDIITGQNDGVMFDGLGLWDVAPACLMIEEAGGKYRLEAIDPSNRKSKVKCVASTSAVFDELCSYIF